MAACQQRRMSRVVALNSSHVSTNPRWPAAAVGHAALQFWPSYSIPEIIFSYSSHHGVPLRVLAISMISLSLTCFAMISGVVCLYAEDVRCPRLLERDVLLSCQMMMEGSSSLSSTPPTSLIVETTLDLGWWAGVPLTSYSG